jgi:hypothetical protein
MPYPSGGAQKPKTQLPFNSDIMDGADGGKDIEWDAIQMLSEPELCEQLSAAEWPAMVAFVKEHSVSEGDLALRSAAVAKWESWCKQHQSSVRLVESDIPGGILPNKLNGSLTDIKVGGKGKFGPDDKLYNNSKDLREKVARGNTVLYLAEAGHASKPTRDNVIFALRKFTGGMGDEDEDQPDTNKTWMSYFLRPVEAAERVICTHKANGEAAHFSVRWIGERFVVFAGSKNVHMAARSRADVQKYRDGRYLVARNVATSVLDMLAELEPSRASLLLSFMHHTQLTAVLEILQPSYQHVVDLSHLSAGELNFITWTLPYDEVRGGDSTPDSYCAMSPKTALDFAAYIGLKSVSYEVIEADKAEERMDKVRRETGYEGEVLYFLDSKDNVIGLLKKKTAWYVLLRAIREKACGALADYKKDKGSYSNPTKKKKMETRLDQIQTWLGFSDEFLEKWKLLSGQFLEWLIVELEEKRLPNEGNLRGAFPAVWNKFLRDKELVDVFEWS